MKIMTIWLFYFYVKIEQNFIFKKENSCLTHIIMKNNNYFISSDIISHSQQQMELDGLHSRSIWIVVKSLKVNKENRVHLKKKPLIFFFQDF